MYSLLAIAALLAAHTIASPVKTIAPKRRAVDGGFSLNVVPKTLPHKTSGPAAVSKAYAKFKGKWPVSDDDNDDDESGFDRSKFHVHAAVGTVVVTPNSYDQEYLAPVYIGGQLLNLDIDTGSSDLWVFSSELSLADQAGHSVYNPNKSSTAHFLPNQTWESQYGDGSSASGNVWTDCVWVGGTVVEGQAIETADEISSAFMSDADSDGIMGLGFDVLNGVVPTLQSTFISNAIKQGLPEPLFTAQLRSQAPGSYDFGYIDASKYTGPLTYAPIDSADGYWRFNTTAFGFSYSNGTSISYPWIGDSIADTGTSILFLDLNIVQGYWNDVSSAYYDRGQGGYAFACDDASILPDLTIAIGNYTAVIPGAQLAYAPLSNGSTTCYGALQGNSGLPFQILGDTFLKNVFAVFNAASPPTIGFADSV